jgi:hypothetical protein
MQSRLKWRKAVMKARGPWWGPLGSYYSEIAGAVTMKWRERGKSLVIIGNKIG